MRLDRIQHIFGTYSFTLFFFFLITQLNAKSIISKTGEFIFIVALGIALGTFVEMIEFLIDIVTTPNIPYQPSLIDTNLDLISDMVGAIIAAFHLNFSRRRNQQELI